MLVTRDGSLLSQIENQSIHMVGKENATTDGPYSIQDRFCRGSTGYAPASPQLLLQALLPGDMTAVDGRNTSLPERMKIFMVSDLLKFPGYVRVEVENYFRHRKNYLESPVFTAFYQL